MCFAVFRANPVRLTRQQWHQIYVFNAPHKSSKSSCVIISKFLLKLAKSYALLNPHLLSTQMDLEGEEFWVPAAGMGR